MSRWQPPPGHPVVHGTYTAYFWHLCRCDACCKYQSERNARNRADRLASGLISHGTRSGYDAGCRCETCRDARRQAYQRLEERSRQTERRQEVAS